MIIRFATKRDINGNRKILIVDLDKKCYSRESSHWFCREDFAEVSKTDFKKLCSLFSDYTIIDYL